MKIHPTAIVDSDVKIESEVEIGPYSFIDKGVILRRGTKIGPHVHIEGETEIGERCEIHTGAVIGTPPQHIKYRNEKTKVFIGEETIIREHVTIHRGTAIRGATKIGKRCMLMAYSHIGHDCTIGDEVIMANVASLAGHVEIEKYAVIGGLVGVHQFVRVGELCMLGAGAMVNMDVVPYTCVVGDRARVYGLNLVGIKRRGYSLETIRNLKKVYRILFHSGLALKEAIAQIKNKIVDDPAIEHIIEFISKTQRGISRERRIGVGHKQRLWTE